MILMLYQPDTVREYVLPKANNQDYTIILDHNQFHIRENIVLKLEVSEYQWILHKSKGYRIRYNYHEEEQVYLQDGDIISLEPDGGAKLQVIVIDVEDAFRVFDKYDIAALDCITIGADAVSMIQYEFQDLISGSHGVIRKAADGYYLDDYSKNGIFVNYLRVRNRIRLSFGDVINIFGLHIVFLDGIIGICANYGKLKVNTDYLKQYKKQEVQEEREIRQEEKQDAADYFNRSPRIIPNIHQEEIEIEPPPNPKISRKKPLLFTIGPSFTMAIPMLLGCLIAVFGTKMSGGSTGIYMYTGIITAVGSAVIGVIWAILNLKYTRQSELEEEGFRFDAYGSYLIEIADLLKKQYAENTNALYAMYCSAQECSRYGENNTNLWNRNRNHSDFLFFRLGLGDIPFQVKIKIPKEKFSVIRDSLNEKPSFLLNEYKMLKNVPVGVNLMNRQLFGIVGGRHNDGSIQVMYNLVAQIAANTCYTDVKLVFIYDETSNQEKERWMFAKWLPHVWSEDKKIRYVATNRTEAKDIFYEVANVIRRRNEEEKQNKGNVPKPYYILFLSDVSVLEGELIKKYIFEPKPEYGITTLIMAEEYAQLPNECENIIQNDSVFQGFYNTMDTTGQKQEVMFDKLSVTELTAMSKRLATVQVRETENNADIPNSLDFLEMYGVNRVENLQVLERWKKNRTYETMQALIGKGVGDSDCYLDIHEKYHGPHGLIAGTTGSGKSETLQTYMLSLAINFSPDDIGFFVIDFKGGGMANLFSDLPHMIGQISNLSGNQIRRAMISIKSENMRRQRIFSEYGVNNINLYTRLYKNNEAKTPIPHLFIIIDEFAELKREEPDFMRELISVAQVGRSLGVHLILATQKPSGTVDDNIWSNAKFRLCLRVQDKQDSNDMLHKPDAAFITQAGRCYMQVGNDEIYELFQSGWSGAVYDEHAEINSSELAALLTSTGKAVLVGSRAKIKRREQERKEYYKAIFDIVMAEMFSSKIYKLVGIEEEQLEQLADNVITRMHEQGMEYERTYANIKKVKDMIRLLAEHIGENNTVDEMTEQIIRTAAKQNVRLPEMKEKTQLDAIVAYLKKLAEENGYKNHAQLWLPVLPRQLYLDSLTERESLFNDSNWKKKEGGWHVEIPIGLYDDPENQAQEPLLISFSEGGHFAVCGTVVSGKSTLLQSMVYSLTMKYTPNDIWIYGLDFSSGMLKPFESMPHIGGILYENDLDGIGKLFHMLQDMIEDRKKLLGGGNYAQYVKAYGIRFPMILLVIDNFANFSEKTENIYSDMIFRIAREGVGYGIFLAISAGGFGMSEIPNRVADNIKTVVCLEMGDKFKYMDILHMTHISVLPETDVKGRGLANVNGTLLEFQTALSVEAEDDYKRNQILHQISEKMEASWNGKKAKKIPHIPENPVWSEFRKAEEVQIQEDTPDWIPIGYWQRDASICGISLADTYCYCISGKTKTGKTNMLRILLEEAYRKNGRIAVIEKDSSELKKAASDHQAEYIASDEELFRYFKDLMPEFVKRNKQKQKYIADGMENAGIFEQMKQEQPIFILIADFAKFLQSVYKPPEGVGNMSGFVENIFAKGELHNVYIFAVINTDEHGKMAGYPAYRTFTEYKKGVHLGGNTASQRIFTFSNIPFTESSKSLKKGIGIVPGEEEDIAEKIVIPLYGK